MNANRVELFKGYVSVCTFQNMFYVTRESLAATAIKHYNPANFAAANEGRREMKGHRGN